MIAWSAISLHPTDPGVRHSFAVSVEGHRQVGYVSHMDDGSAHRAARWDSSAGSFHSLNPHGAVQSEALCIRDSTIVGWMDATQRARSALRWLEGGAQLMHLVGARGEARAHSGDVSGGMFKVDAHIWLAAGDPVRLHQEIEGAVHGESLVNGMDGDQRVGTVWTTAGLRAYLWVGLPSVEVILHPTTFSDSEASGVHHGVQVGRVGTEACLWSGTAASLRILHPTGADYSHTAGIFGHYQVGHAAFNGLKHAGVWTGTADSWQSLHAVLPPAFNLSRALGVWVSSLGQISVVGDGYNALAGRFEALLWIGQPHRPIDDVLAPPRPTRL